jgi:hypothetical protein
LGTGERVAPLSVTAQGDHLRDLLHLMDDQHDLTIGAEHGCVGRCPPTFDEAPIRASHQIALDRHDIGRPGADHPLQRCGEIAHAVGVGLFRIRGVRVEQPTSDLFLARDARQAEQRLAFGDDRPVRRRDDEQRRRRRFEQRLEIGGRQFCQTRSS